MAVIDFGFFENLISFFKKPAQSPRWPLRPTTFESAVDLIASKIEQPENDDPLFHTTAGVFVRNYLDLWNKESDLSRHMNQRFGLCHADDTSMLIVNAVCAKNDNIPYDIDADINRCKEHWRRVGIDPATMERI